MSVAAPSGWCLPLYIYIALSALSLGATWYASGELNEGILVQVLIYAAFAAVMFCACKAGKSWISWMLLFLPLFLAIALLVLGLAFGVVVLTARVSNPTTPSLLRV